MNYKLTAEKREAGDFEVEVAVSVKRVNSVLQEFGQVPVGAPSFTTVTKSATFHGVDRDLTMKLAMMWAEEQSLETIGSLAAEREECAKLAEAESEVSDTPPERMDRYTLSEIVNAAIRVTKRNIAAAIRARGKS